MGSPFSLTDEGILTSDAIILFGSTQETSGNFQDQDSPDKAYDQQDGTTT